ncbi:hypothetical protein N9864_00845 [bacterium]|nr:hypothetical protein [bacterium]
MDNRDRILFIMVGGVMALLTIIVLGDFWISLKENRPIDDDVVQLLQMSITYPEFWDSANCLALA